MKIEIDIDVHVDMDEDLKFVDERQSSMGRKMSVVFPNPPLGQEREAVKTALEEAVRAFIVTNGLNSSIVSL